MPASPPQNPPAAPGDASRFAQPAAGPGGEPERLFSLDPSIIDKIFTDHLGVSEQVMAKMPKTNINETVKAISDAAQQVPKIEGLGRLDARIDTTNEAGSGRIASIGKFLLDGKDLEKIGKITSSDPSDTKMRILTPEGAAELNSILQHVGAHPGVLGSVIIGHDGLLIVNNMPPEMDAEYFGVMAYTVFMSTTHATAKMGSQRVEQIVSKTPLGYLVIANFGNGLLVTASDVQVIEGLIPLLRSITQLVAP
jgi:predicted regulator of Ras-like GTPase activity (Roadblock/LC7/MglB family)